jgi:hypothetical protein
MFHLRRRKPNERARALFSPPLAKISLCDLETGDLTSMNQRSHIKDGKFIEQTLSLAATKETKRKRLFSSLTFFFFSLRLLFFIIISFDFAAHCHCSLATILHFPSASSNYTFYLNFILYEDPRKSRNKRPPPCLPADTPSPGSARYA